MVDIRQDLQSGALSIFVQSELDLTANAVDIQVRMFVENKVYRCPSAHMKQIDSELLKRNGFRSRQWMINI